MSLVSGRDFSGAVLFVRKLRNQSTATIGDSELGNRRARDPELYRFLLWAKTAFLAKIPAECDPCH